MNEEFILTWGYLGLFIVTFLSASLAPLVTQPFLFAMERLGFNLWLILAIATLGNYCGSLTTYAIGRFGGGRLLDYLRPDPKRLEQASNLFEKWGIPILFFSWIPILGDALIFTAGLFKSNLLHFSLWFLPGKWLYFAAGLGIFQAVFSWI